MTNAIGRRVFGAARRGWVAAVLAAGLTAGAPATGGAQPVCPTTGTLQSLIDFGGTGCIIDDKIFQFFGSNITAVGFTTGLDETNILYEIHNPSPYHVGFELIGAWFAPAGGILEQNLRYRVTTVGGRRIMHDLSLQQFGEDVFGGPVPPGTGYISIAEDACIGGLFSAVGGCVAGGGFIRSLTTFYAEDPVYGPTNHEDATFWGPPYVNVLDIDKDILVFGGTGGAVFSNLHQDISQVPEPATVVLFGAGLGLLGIVARRRRRPT